MMRASETVLMSLFFAAMIAVSATHIAPKAAMHIANQSEPSQ